MTPILAMLLFQAAPIPSSQVTDYWVSHQAQQMIAVLEAMPAVKYAFAPTDGEFRHVRTFGEQAKHLAAFNYIAAAAMRQEPPPADAGDEQGPDTVRTKAQIIAYVRGSYEALQRASETIDEPNAVIATSPQSPLGNHTTRLGLAEEALIHAMDHYGQMIEYLRMNYVIPPGSR